jgi:hypothetical protein
MDVSLGGVTVLCTQDKGKSLRIVLHEERMALAVGKLPSMPGPSPSAFLLPH